jgi:dTDP-4-amino-4,6-dideoxygalactose transaminase/dTDP-glucose pyrophosphorylase
MRAIVLAGGFGTRLQPYTQTTPKPLMELDGTPILDIALGQVRDSGATHVTLCLFYRADEIQSHVGDGSRYGIEIEYSVADRLLGTAGPLSLLPRPEEPCLVMNADVLTSLNYYSLWHDHVEHDADVTMVVARQPVGLDFGVVDVTEDGALRGLYEKPSGEVLVNAGIYCLDPRAWDLLPPGRRRDMTALIDKIRNQGGLARTYCLARDATWIDIGRIEQYYEANRHFRRTRGGWTTRPLRDLGPDGDDPARHPAGLAALDHIPDGESTGEIQLYDPNLGEEEVVAVTSVIRSRWISQGSETRAFELECAEQLGVEEAVAVSSGTAALHLAGLALGLGEGDEVIVPSLTFVASAAVFGLCEATPVFCEVRGEDDLTVDPRDVEARITPRTRAVVAMHYGGYSAALDELRAICDRHGLFLIEDAAHAPMVPSTYGMLGTVGDVGCFSFFATKNLTMGEGGLVVARDPEVLDRVRTLRSHAQRPLGVPGEYDVEAFGLNYRPTEIGSVIGRVQLRKLAIDRERRRERVVQYHEGLAGVPGVILPFSGRPDEGAHHLMPILLEPGTDRGEFRERLRSEGVQTTVHYPSIHLFTEYRRRYGYEPGALPRTEDITARVLSLPLHARLTSADVRRVVRCVSGGVLEPAA